MDQLTVLAETNVIQAGLRAIAESKGAVVHTGDKCVRFTDFIINNVSFKNSEYHRVVLDWITSEHGNWVLSRVANIMVTCQIDNNHNLFQIIIYAYIDDSLATEHSLTWND